LISVQILIAPGDYQRARLIYASARRRHVQRRIQREILDEGVYKVKFSMKAAQIPIAQESLCWVPEFHTQPAKAAAGL